MVISPGAQRVTPLRGKPADPLDSLKYAKMNPHPITISVFFRYYKLIVLLLSRVGDRQIPTILHVQIHAWALAWFSSQNMFGKNIPLLEGPMKK